MTPRLRDGRRRDARPGGGRAPALRRSSGPVGPVVVTPAEAGVQRSSKALDRLDSRLRGNDATRAVGPEPLSRDLPPRLLVIAVAALLVAAAGPAAAEEGAVGGAAPADAAAAADAAAEAEEGAASEGAALPGAASLRRHLAEPVGPWPGPWAALSAVLEGGSRVDRAAGWTALRVHVPVASRYGAVDARLTLLWDGEGFQGIEPEIWLRALPLRLVDGGRAVLGVALGFGPALEGGEARLTLTGGLVGGFLGDLWFARAFVATRGEVIARASPPDLVASLAAGLRLVRGQVRPQLEVDLVVPASEAAAEELALTLRPALRYWPAPWIGLGLSGEALLTGPGSPSGTLRLDVVVQAREAGPLSGSRSSR